MWGVVPKSSTNQFQIPLKSVDRLPFDHFLFGMVTCHSITILNGRMMGDPLDLKMFESTGWELEDSNNIPDTEKYGILYPTILRQPRGGLSGMAETESGSKNEIKRDVGKIRVDMSSRHRFLGASDRTSCLKKSISHIYTHYF